MLFTSPVRDQEITFGKWLGAMLLYGMILAISIAELAISFMGHEHDWRTILVTYPALAFQGAGVLAIGEFVSSFSKHESSAAWLTFLVCMAVLRYSRSGRLGAPDFVLCVVLMAAGWLLTWRSIQKLRGAF
jgi:ABC-type transport system involved in multi-copper enzyme maturation permease subunit